MAHEEAHREARHAVDPALQPRIAGGQLRDVAADRKAQQATEAAGGTERKAFSTDDFDSTALDAWFKFYGQSVIMQRLRQVALKRNVLRSIFTSLCQVRT